MRTNRNQTSYLASLDGVRALAIILVLAYHFNMSFFKGGFIGVDIFFVLSGYLITSKLLQEWQTHKQINLKVFWIKRIRRLMPAVIALISVTLLVCLILFPAVFKKSWQDGIASLFYVSNWWYIVKEIPYFESFGIPSPFKHLWSLAIEEQFYLIWPIVFVALLKTLKKRQHVLKVIVGSALVSAVWMAFLYSPENIDRVYYGTDTRLLTLAVGCSLAFVWPYYYLKSGISEFSRNVIDSIGIVSLVSLLVIATTVSAGQPFLYYGGFLLVAILSALLLATLVHPDSQMGLLFSQPWLVWLGKRSYSIYLWHFPVTVLTTPIKSSGTLHPLLILLQIALTMVLSIVSYEWLEEPIRRLGFKAYAEKTKDILNYRSKKLMYCLLAIVGLSGALTMAYDYYDSGKILGFIKEATVLPKQSDEKPKDTKKIVEIHKMLAVGDSIMLSLKKELEEEIPGIKVDGKISRQLWQATDLVKKKYKNYNSEDSLVVLELGTNSEFKQEQLDELLDLFDKAHVMVINSRVPKPWEQVVNDMLLGAANERENVRLIDWHSIAVSNPQLLNSDAVHPNEEGIPIYITMITDNLERYDLKLPEVKKETSETKKDKTDNKN